MAKDFSKRTKSTQRNSATTSGFMNEFIHLDGVQTNYAITPAGGYVLKNIIFGTAPGSGTVVLKVGNDILAEFSNTVATGSIRFDVYLYDSLKYSNDATCDVTFVISKG